MKAYTINYAENTITVTKKFMEAAGIIGSYAFNQMKVLRTMGMAIITRDSKSRNTQKVTYEQMLQYINCVENRSFYLSRFEAVREEAKSKKVPYVRVLEWFSETFPTFDDKPVFNERNEIIVPSVDYLKEVSRSEIKPAA